MSGAPVSGGQDARTRFLAGPTSAMGRITVVLVLVLIIAVVLMATVIEPARPAWRTTFGIFVVALVLSTAVCGGIAVVAKRERSWAVVIPTILCLAIAVNEVVQQIGVS